jgi:hypothetical protein
MYTADEIAARLYQKPFQPMRVLDSEGRHYNIYYPDLVTVTRQHLMIGSPDPVTPSIYDRITYVGLMYIVGLEDLPTPPPTSGNWPQP